MKKNIITAFLLGMTILGMNANIVNADDSISISEAKQMAWLQVNSVREQKQDIGEWSSNLKIENTQNLYDCDNNITAYCINFVDKDNNDCGYVVVGANDDYDPIVEFATSGDFFTEKGEKTYYLGEYDYFVQKTDDVNVLENVSDKTNIEDKYISIKEAKRVYKKEDHVSEWKFYKKNYLTEKSDIELKATGASIQTITNKDANSIIYDPYALEDDWISVAPIDAAKYNITYFSTLDFSGYNNHCGANSRD